MSQIEMQIIVMGFQVACLIVQIVALWIIRRSR